MSTRLRCLVRSVDDTGASASTATGETVFIALHELSWDRSVRPIDILSIGDVCDALVIGRSAGMVFGSRKRAATQDPWRDRDRYQVGDEVFGVTFATPDPTIDAAALPGGAIAVYPRATGSACAPAPGVEVRLVLVEVEHERRYIAAHCREHQAGAPEGISA